MISFSGVVGEDGSAKFILTKIKDSKTIFYFTKKRNVVNLYNDDDVQIFKKFVK